MAGRAKTIMFRGPWRGVELREPYQQDEHCEIAINVDFSNGYIEARKGFVVAVASGTEQPRMARIHVHDNPDGRQYLLAVGLMDSDDGNQEIGLYAARLDGARLAEDDVQQLGSERGSYQFQCSFIDTFLPTDGSSEPTKYVTLISTPNSTYVFDPDTWSSELSTSLDTAKVDAATPGNTLKINDANFAYWETTPFGAITAWHQGRVYYAGFSPKTEIELSETLEATQNLIPESIIKSGRNGYVIGPNWFAFSDEFDPGAVQAHHVISTEEAEQITGLKTYKEDLVIFTDKGIHIMTGATDDTYAIYKVVSDVGCVSHGSIVEAGGLLYFMAADGIYAFDGSQVVNLSVPIQALWTHDWERVPSANATLRTLLAGLEYPWLIDRDTLNLCNGMHYNDKHQIWWSVSVLGDTHHLSRVTVVWDYIHQAWSFYVRGYRGAKSVMHDGVTFRDTPSSKQQVFVSTGRGDPSLFEYGGPADEAVSIPMVWVSGRLLKENDNNSRVRPIMLKMLSSGKTPSSNKPIWFVESENCGYETASAVTTYAKTGTLKTHPKESVGNFWGTSSWEFGKWEGPDWFTAEVEAAGKGRWFRFGVIDDGDSDGRGVLVKIQSFSADVVPGTKRGTD